MVLFKVVLGVSPPPPILVSRPLKTHVYVCNGVYTPSPRCLGEFCPKSTICLRVPLGSVLSCPAVDSSSGLWNVGNRGLSSPINIGSFQRSELCVVTPTHQINIGFYNILKSSFIVTPTYRRPMSMF